MSLPTLVTLSSPVDDAKCYKLVHLHWGISQEKLPAYPCYLGFFQFVHNTRRRGKALLGALIFALVS
jgi:hypothetical protein